MNQNVHMNIKAKQKPLYLYCKYGFSLFIVFIKTLAFGEGFYEE